MPNSYQRNHQELDSLVAGIHKKHPSYGYRSINAAILMDTGWKMCAHSVMESMQRLGIRSKARKKRCASAGSEHTVFPNILARQFCSDRPMQRIAVDICQFRGGGRRYYFIAFLDMFNNEILSWNLGKQEDMTLVLPALRYLLSRKDPDLPLLIHSDQGSQFAAYSYTKLLKDHNVTQSMSRAGTPRDNAVIESCFGWFKNMLYPDFNIRMSTDVLTVVKKAVEHFNCFPPAFALNYTTPEHF